MQPRRPGDRRIATNRRVLSLFGALGVLCALMVQAQTTTPSDPRNLRHGLPIPDEGYCDQPYVVVGADGRWLCVMTTGRGHEGQRGQHVVSTVSADRGHTWSPLVDIEPAEGPEASWAVPLLASSGRVYVFYTYNGDRVGTLQGKAIRADMLGWYVAKYTDDFGRSWSGERLRLPLRLTECDRSNDWNGEVQIFWGICKPQTADGEVLVAVTKLGRYMLDQGEGWLLRSANVLEEPDPARVRWELLPAGDHGIRAAAFGSVQEEHNLVWLGGQRWYCVYRTTQGYPVHTYSADGGRTWEAPTPMTYTPGGRVVKHPRACPKIWRTADGRFLFWFHHHGGTSFENRNPAWIAGGVLRNGRLHWSQPEILFYDPDPQVRLSYPDLIEQDGRFWVTETQKTTARVHEVPRALLEPLWHEGDDRTVARDGCVLDGNGERADAREVTFEEPLDLRADGGFTLECWVTFRDLAGGQILLENRDGAGRGIVFETDHHGSVRLTLSDGPVKSAWSSDRGVLQAGRRHHLVAIVDAGPRIIRFVIDGVLGDGGAERAFGWDRYTSQLDGVRWPGHFRLGPSLRGESARLRIYQRPLRTAEAVAHFHAGPGAAVTNSP